MPIFESQGVETVGGDVKKRPKELVTEMEINQDQYTQIIVEEMMLIYFFTNQGVEEGGRISQILDATS